MKKQDFILIAIEKLEKLSTEDLISQVKRLTNVFSDGAMIVSNCILDILENRMEEDNFITLCESLLNDLSE